MKSKDQTLLEKAYKSIFFREEYTHSDPGDETEELDREYWESDPGNKRAFAALDSLYTYWRAYNPHLDEKYFRFSIENMEDERLLAAYEIWKERGTSA